jgi:hypothetical protein
LPLQKRSLNNHMTNIPFPVELLVPKLGASSKNEFGISIEIPIEPFHLPTWDKIETELLLDCIKLPTTDFSKLSGKTFKFPKNPDDGYIDGSIYIGYHHHPVDVTAIEFGQVDGKAIMANISAHILFSFEGLAVDDCAEDNASEYEDTDWQFSAKIVLEKHKS